MVFDIQELNLPGVLLIRSKRFIDARGYFSETYNRGMFTRAGIDMDFVQDNHSLSLATGTVRGLHFQSSPMAQSKLVRAVRGRILDVAVDIRKSSSHFGRHVTAELSAKDGNQLLIPAGFAHGFCTLEPDTEVVYKVDQYYSLNHDLGIRWNDPALRIRWPVDEQAAILSDKDKLLPLLADAQIL